MNFHCLESTRLAASALRHTGIAAGILLLGACSNHAPPGEVIDFRSADYVFLSEPLAGQPGVERTVSGLLLLPGSTATREPYPAVIMLHSSWGRGQQEWNYSKHLLDRGIAVFAIDSFHPRGEYNTSRDQSLVSETSMLQDAFSALDRLAADPRIDPGRIGILGFSKGGIVALYSALRRISTAMSKDGNRFAAHVAYYPWCGIRMMQPVTTGKPILIQTGRKDTITPLALCEEFAVQLRLADENIDIEVVGYENARHGFDHPMLKRLSWVPMGAQIPGDCRIREVSPLSFVEESTGQNVDAMNVYDILNRCGGTNGVAGGNSAAGEEAMQAMLEIFSLALFGKRRSITDTGALNALNPVKNHALNNTPADAGDSGIGSAAKSQVLN